VRGASEQRRASRLDPGPFAGLPCS